MGPIRDYMIFVLNLDLIIAEVFTVTVGSCVESGISGSIREYQESRSGMRVSGVPDIRESGPTGYPGYLRDIRNQDQGWGYQVLSLIEIPDSTQVCTPRE